MLDNRPICFDAPHEIFENWNTHNFIPDGLMKLVRENHRVRMRLNDEIIRDTSTIRKGKIKHFRLIDY